MMIIDGVRVPRFIYGTAWKNHETARLTGLAVEHGFRGIDTANQQKHYDEAGVGEGIHKALKIGLLARSDLFLQTKFTFRGGQDHRLPYDTDAPLAKQVAQSFDSSLEHLGTDIIDSYLLHSPNKRGAGLGSHDWEVWRAMEALHGSRRARLLGISNVSLEQLKILYKEARVLPRIVQNRCYATQGWDRSVRQFCVANGIIYQGFSLLTANRKMTVNGELIRLAERYRRTVSQMVFRFALDVGIVPLTGTTSVAHMLDDLAILDFVIEQKDLAMIEVLAGAS
jgi:diketogulonate reductase-like aldo/keto reductase